MDVAVAEAVNDQVRQEFESAYFYLSLSAYFESLSLAGFAHWMRQQAQEEIRHGMKFFDFMTDSGQRVTLQAIAAPPRDFASPLEACQRVLENERNVTSLIHNLYGLAMDRKEYPAQVLLQWFVQEQVEEEKSATRIVEELKLAGTSPGAALLIDHDLGARQAPADPV